MEENDNIIEKIEKYDKLISEIKDIVSIEKYLSYTDEIQDIFLCEFSKENVIDEYSTLNIKIKKFISSRQFGKMPNETKDFL